VRSEIFGNGPFALKVSCHPMMHVVPQMPELPQSLSPIMEGGSSMGLVLH